MENFILPTVGLEQRQGSFYRYRKNVQYTHGILTEKGLKLIEPCWRGRIQPTIIVYSDSSVGLPKGIRSL